MLLIYYQRNDSQIQYKSSGFSLCSQNIPIFYWFLPLFCVLYFSFSPADAFKPPQRSIDKPFRLCVSDVFKGKSHWCILSKSICDFIRIPFIYFSKPNRLLMLHFILADQGSGFCVTGKIEAGYIQTGDRILAIPPNETCTVKGTVCTIVSLLLLFYSGWALWWHFPYRCLENAHKNSLVSCKENFNLNFIYLECCCFYVYLCQR